MKTQTNQITKTKRTMGTHALAAKAARKELKISFPTIKFSVTSETYSMGDSVNIYWTDGPTRTQVDEITKKYQEGHFDGMIDCYEYSNTNDNLPQVKYVMATRNLSKDKVREFAKEYMKKWDLKEPTDDLDRNFEWHEDWTSWNRIAWKNLHEVSL